MITVVSATNRPASKTSVVAKLYYQEAMRFSTEIVRYFSLEDIPLNILNDQMYEKNGQPVEITLIQDQYFIPADKWIIVIPEYNGGIPGIFKLLIDSLSVRKYEETFKDKKICLVGVSTGRAGNLRGLDYLTNVFHYVRSRVFPMKLPISRIQDLLDDKHQLIDEPTLLTVRDHVKKFCEF